MKTLMLVLGLSVFASACSSDKHMKKEPVDENIKQEEQEQQMRTGDSHKSDEYGPGYDYGRTSPTI